MSTPPFDMDAARALLASLPEGGPRSVAVSYRSPFVDVGPARVRLTMAIGQEDDDEADQDERAETRAAARWSATRAAQDPAVIRLAQAASLAPDYVVGVVLAALGGHDG